MPAVSRAPIVATGRLVAALMLAVAVAVAVSCSSPSAEPSASDAADAADGPGVVLQAAADGLALTVQIDRVDVAPGGDIGARVTLQNQRAEPVAYMDPNCQEAPTWTLESLALPIEPLGQTWAGIAGEFKRYALTEGFGAGGVPATDPIDIVVKSRCDPFPQPDRLLAPGGSAVWTLT